MTDHTALVAQYIACWNETDEARRRALVAATFADDVRYTDPLMQGTGREALDGLIRGAQAQFPGFRFALTRAPERVDDHVRFSWQLGPAGAPGFVEGTDFARIAPDGRLASVHGFLDRVPSGAPDASAGDARGGPAR